MWSMILASPTAIDVVRNWKFRRLIRSPAEEDCIIWVRIINSFINAVQPERGGPIFCKDCWKRKQKDVQKRDEVVETKQDFAF